MDVPTMAVMVTLMLSIWPHGFRWKQIRRGNPQAGRYHLISWLAWLGVWIVAIAICGFFNIQETLGMCLLFGVAAASLIHYFFLTPPFDLSNE